MSEKIIQIKSITQLHEMLGIGKPKHPLITLIDVTKVSLPSDLIGVRLAPDFYTIALKDGHCGMMYGRKYFDFEEGVLIFTAPGQVIAITEEINLRDDGGWMLIFHPDLIRATHLGKTVENYSFFSYEANEALHLSDDEKKILSALLSGIQSEYEQRIDNHSNRVIVSSLDLLLNYCSRFYERQFNTRTALNKTLVMQVEDELNNYFKSGQLAADGPPSIQFLAEKVHLSPNYLSDVLRKETGRSAKDHINDFLVEKAKNLLAGSDQSVSEIAYSLGFNYPHYFSRLFKNKTGMTPQGYRDIN